jgi:putative transposase
MDSFTHWYKHEHRHTGIGLHTPADVHFGLATDKAADRRAVLTGARARHPHRFGTLGAPKILDLDSSTLKNCAGDGAGYVGDRAVGCHSSHARQRGVGAGPERR